MSPVSAAPPIDEHRLSRCATRPSRAGRRSAVAALLAAALLAGCTSAPSVPTTRPAPPPPLTTPPPPVVQALQRARLPTDALAAVVAPALPAGPAGTVQARRDQAAPRLALQPDRAMQPASTMKLVTSVVALDRLGPDHRGYTELRSAAPLVGEVLQGDLVLRGGADPEFNLPQLWALLAELRDQGIREIAGDLIVDRTLFRPARMDLGLPPFDASPEFPYNVIPDALSLQGSLMPIELSADAERLSVRGLPALPGLTFDTGAMRLNDKACKDWDDDWQPAELSQRGDTLHVALRGAYPRGCYQRAELQLIDRQALTERLVRVTWQGLGGIWSGRAREAAAPAETRLLARRQSRPWGELLRQLNKQSDNAWTRLLYLSLGVPGMAAEPTATTLALSRREVLRWFAEQGIASEGLVLDNGSGLSRSERITPRQMVEMLQTAQAGALAPELLMSLPLAGVDGSMRNRLKDGPAAGSARLKPGTLRNVVALAGYVPDTQGRLWVVAAMINHDDAARGRPVLDALIDWVAGGGLDDDAR